MKVMAHLRRANAPQRRSLEGRVRDGVVANVLQYKLGRRVTGRVEKSCPPTSPYLGRSTACQVFSRPSVVFRQVLICLLVSSIPL